MARKVTGLSILTLVFGLASFALAQQPGGTAPGGLLFLPDVKKDLKLSEEQVGKLKDALNRVMEKYRGNFEKFQKTPPSAQEGEKTMKAFQEETEKAVEGILDAKQIKRFRQIEWQLNGVGALQDPELQKELKITDEQKKKLDVIFRDTEKKWRELADRRESAKEKYDAVMKDADGKVNDVLTEEQKKNWKVVLGPKFEFTRQGGTPPKGDR